MFEEERPQFESNLFSFQSKKANRIASYCLLGGLGFGLLLGVIFVFCGGSWFRSIAFCTTSFGLLGLAAGFVVGTRIDAKKRKKSSRNP